MGLKLVLAIGLDDPGMTDAEEMNRPSDAARLNRLPIAVEDENGLIEDTIHTPFPTIARKLTKSGDSATQKVGWEMTNDEIRMTISDVLSTISSSFGLRHSSFP